MALAAFIAISYISFRVAISSEIEGVSSINF